MKVREGARRGREGKGSRRGLWRTLPVPAGSQARPPQLCHSRRLTMSSLGTCPWPPGRRLQPAGSEACLLSQRRWGYTLAFRKHTPLLQSGASFSARASWDTCVPTRISLGHPRRSSSLGPSVPRMSRDIFDRHDQDGAIVISRVEPKDAAKCPTVPRTGDSPARQRIIRPRASAVPRLRTPGPHNADLVFSRGHWDSSTGHDGS